MSQADAHSKLADIIATDDREATNKRYNGWADTYEQDMATVQYFGPKKLMEIMDKLNVAKDAKILDFCSGTGALGRELTAAGYTNLHAIDGAESMLEKAKQEGNYQSYTLRFFEPGTKLPFDDNQFDAVLLAGVFAPGHLPILALEEVVRICKPGGVTAWIQCDPLYYQDKDPQYADNGFMKLVEDIKARGLWKEHEGFPIKVPYIEYSDGYIMAYDMLQPAQEA